jgi:fucose 4-O-acetylase-like acetyltransferase
MRGQVKRGELEKKPNVSRDAVVDATRGLAILLVVLGHALQSHLATFDDNYLYKVIYAFHMPLFFFLSGWVAKPDSTGRARKTLTRLLPPTLCWYCIQFLVEQRYKHEGLGAYFIAFFKHPDVGLWFLWVLAFSMVALVCLRKAERVIGIWAYPTGLAVLFLIPIGSLGIPLIKYYSPYLIAGYLLHRYPEIVKQLWRYGVAASILIFPLVLPFWQRAYGQPTGGRVWHFAGHQIPLGMIKFLSAKYIEGVAGSILAVCLVYIIWKYVGSSILEWFGMRSLDIYVSHQLIISIFPSSRPIAICGAFVIPLCASIVAAVVLKRIAILKFLLYGGPFRWSSPLIRPAHRDETYS